MCLKVRCDQLAFATAAEEVVSVLLGVAVESPVRTGTRGFATSGDHVSSALPTASDNPLTQFSRGTSKRSTPRRRQD